MKKITLILLFICSLVKAQITSLDNWKTKGNTFSTSTNYLGTNNAQSLVLKTNSLTAVTIATNQVVSTSTNLTVGGRMSAASLSVTAQTFSVGTTNYTAGNTGTVAVLSDAVFPVNFTHGATNIADATTYYFGNSGYLLSVAASSGSITIPYNCTLVGWDYNAVVAGVIGTSETSTLSINGSTTNYTLSSSITYSAAGAYQGFSASGLSQNFVAGERINAKLISGSFATNPTAVYGGLTLWFVRRH